MTEKQKVTPNMKAAKNESGKSMVEMLGVLALMGLLAILGAKGYNMAMERAMANEIINDVNKRSLLHSQQLLAGSALDVSEMPDKIRDIYPVSAEKLGVQFFTLKVSQVETPVCRRIADLGYTIPIQVTANGTKITPDNTTPCENQTGIVEMAFTFNRTLTPCPDCLDDIRQCASTSNCASGYSCQNGLCVCDVPCKNACCPTGQQCVNNTCTSAEVCDDGLCEDGVCLPSGLCGCYSYRDCQYFCIINDNDKFGVCSTTPNQAQGSGTNGIFWSQGSFNWYTGKDFCDSLGTQMVSFEDLGCVKKESIMDWDCSKLKTEFKGKGFVWVSNPGTATNMKWQVGTSHNGVVYSIGYNGRAFALCK